MARAMWKGAIQFGLVTIPVKLYLATESKSTISFNLLHETDLSRIQMKIWCPEDEKLIARSETVRGYEYAPDQYVVVTDEDLAAVPLKTVRAIEIEQFVQRDGTSADSPVRFVRQAYYVEPDRIARKAFTLLREVLLEQGLTAICKVVIKDREVLASLDPFEGTMLLSTLHWPDEIRSVADLDLGDEAIEFKPAEKLMAAQLVAAMTGEFDPSQYRDEYREAVERIIEAKVEGQETVTVAEPEPTGKLIDLMAALEASVNAAKAARAEAPVSVAEAKQRKAATGRAGTPSGRTGTAATSAKPAGRKPAAAPAEEEAEAQESRPARRRKSA